MSDNRLIEKIKQIAFESGKIMLSASFEDFEITEKTSSKDIVTRYDEEIQEYIIQNIAALLSDAQFIAEESAEYGSLLSGNLFIIDPIDGTANFVHGIGYSAVSIAWYKMGKPFFGVVYNPYTDEMYYAQSGCGAYLNDKYLRIKQRKLKESVVVFGTSPYNMEKSEETFERIQNMYTNCQDIRRFGSSALDICHVADGSVGLYFEACLSLWDYAAAKLILQEAGGEALTFQGSAIPLSIEKTSLIVGHPMIICESNLIGGKL